MMIGPDNYVEMNLRGKSRDAAMSEVKALWKEIRRLKKVMEEEPDSREMMIMPGPDVKISCSRDYLEAAREYFESRGWEYEPAPEEVRDRKFNDRLKDLESIVIEYGGFLCGGEKRTIRFDGEKILVDREYLMRPMSEEELQEVPSDCFHGMGRSDLISELADLHLGEWEKEYEDICVLDGIQWSVVIRFSSGKVFMCSGSNRFPYNFYRFLEVVGMEDVEML